jgi:hypothetical protein
VVVSVGAEDFAGDPRRAIAFQRELEAKAYAAGRNGWVSLDYAKKA